MKHLFGLIFLFTFAPSWSQTKAILGKTSYPFLCHLPADSVLKNKPALLIFLHGRSLSGTDLNRVRRYGILTEVEKGRNIPAIVVAPQLKPGESWNPDKVLEILNWVHKEYTIDTNRVYVAGMSLGGYGTMHFVARYPEKVAAAGAFCGGGNVKDACRMATVPMWIIHGKRDKAVPFSESEKVVLAMKDCPKKEKLIFTVLPDAGHGEPERWFHKDEFYDWLFSHSNALLPEEQAVPSTSKP